MANGRFWTTGELARLKEMAGQHPPWQIGMRLNRTASAVRTMCRNIGISYRQEIQRRRDELIEQMAGLVPTPVIAWKLECGTRTVQLRARRLGISLRMIRLGNRPLLPAKKPRHPGLTYIRTPGLIRKRWKARPDGQYIGYFATEAEAWAAIKERDHNG